MKFLKDVHIRNITFFAHALKNKETKKNVDPNRLDKNRAIHAQKLARGLLFWI